MVSLRHYRGFRKSLVPEFFICIFLILVSCENEKSQLYENDLIDSIIHAETDLILGDDERDGAIFGKPIGVAIDNEDNIYVADELYAKIRVFGLSGDSLTEFGSRGRGPGEFTSLTSLDITDSVLSVVDHWNLRVSNFSLEGKLLEDHTYLEKNMIWPRQIKRLDNGNYLLFYQNYRDSDKYLHVLDSSFTEVITEFATENELVNSDPFPKWITRNRSQGHFVLLDSKTILLNLLVNDGTIQVFKNENGTWNKSQDWDSGNGDVASPTWIALAEDELTITGSIRATREEPSAGKVLWQTIGMLRQGHQVYSFISSQEGDVRKFYLDTFTTEGKFMGRSYIENWDRPLKYGLSPIKIWATTSKGQFVLTDSNDGVPVVKVVTLSDKNGNST